MLPSLSGQTVSYHLKRDSEQWFLFIDLEVLRCSVIQHVLPRVTRVRLLTMFAGDIHRFVIFNCISVGHSRRRFRLHVTGLVVLEVVYRSFVAHVERAGRPCSVENDTLLMHSSWCSQRWRRRGVSYPVIIVRWRNLIFNTHLNGYLFLNQYNDIIYI